MSETQPNDSVPSKSELKREAQEIFKLGRRLVGMTAPQLQALPLESDVRNAISDAQSIRSNKAHKRQLGFLAGLLRKANLEPLRAALDAVDNSARESHASHHRCEAWRDTLLQEGDAALSRLLEACQDAPVQQLRQLIRNAQREASNNKPPASARKLFRALRAIDQQNALPPV